MVTAVSARRGFSSPDETQMTNEGMAAVTVPATTVTTAGRRDGPGHTARATAKNPAKIPMQHSRAMPFGNSTRSGTPNQLPRSNRPIPCPDSRIASHAGFEYPSASSPPGCRTGPAPAAIDRA